MSDRIEAIAAEGQAVWLDFISRELLNSGRLEQLVATGVTGVTSNPTIFQKAIAGGADYDEQIRAINGGSARAYEIYETLAVQDIQDAADVLREVYEATDARDGYVSIEVRPKLAHDADATIVEARRLFQRIDRPNVMIKVPATEDGLPAIETLIGEGINVNVTLIFAVAMYDQVMQAYLAGLRRLQKQGGRLDRVASVASFFVSRVDSLVDARLQALIEDGHREAEGLLGKAAVANARMAYCRFMEVFGCAAFDELRKAGARVQRPLWASTSAKNPAYADTKYVDELIGPETVNTMPPHTLEAARDHADVRRSIDADLPKAFEQMNALSRCGINMMDVTDRLLVDGVRAFADSFDQLLADVDRKRAELVHAG